MIFVLHFYLVPPDFIHCLNLELDVFMRRMCVLLAEAASGGFVWLSDSASSDSFCEFCFVTVRAANLNLSARDCVYSPNML